MSIGKHLNGHAVPLWRGVLTAVLAAGTIGAWMAYVQLATVVETVSQLDRRLAVQIADHQRQLDIHEGRIQRIENWRMGPL